MHEQPFRLGLIGAGSIAGAHLRGAQTVPRHVTVVALAEPNGDNRRTMQWVFAIYEPARLGRPVELEP